MVTSSSTSWLMSGSGVYFTLDKAQSAGGEAQGSGGGSMARGTLLVDAVVVPADAAWVGAPERSSRECHAVLFLPGATGKRPPV